MALSAAVALLGLIFTGCSEPTIPAKKAETYVGGWAGGEGRSIEGQVEVPEVDGRLESVVTKAAEKDEAKVDRSEPPYDTFLKEVYGGVGWTPKLVAEAGLTDRGRTVWDVLSKAGDHALQVEDFEFEAIDRELEALQKADRRVDSLSAFQPNDREQKAARKWLTSQAVADFDLSEQNYAALTEAVIASKAGNRLTDRIADLEAALADRADARARLEYLLARNTARYARQMKHFRLRHLFIHPREDDYWSDPVTEGRRPDEALGPRVAGRVWRRAAKIADEMKEPVAILHRRIRQTLKSVLTDEDAGAVLADLQPEQPQYAGLQKAYVRYKKIVEEGGWEKVPVDRHLDPGDSGETVKKLKKRLQIEGYYPADAPIDETYGERLEEAITTYQETHQMGVTGEPHGMFWGSINKPAEWRMKQLGLNLQRWRESNVRHSDERYVMVNIPGFHVEAWNDQTRDLRIRIVVGNDDKKKKEDSDETYSPNHTPELSAYIDRVIYNPFWNVTDRIRNNEILPKVRRSVEEKYMAKIRTLKKKKLANEKAAADAASEESTEEPDGPAHLVATGPDGPGGSGMMARPSADVSDAADQTADPEESGPDPRASDESDAAAESDSAEAQGDGEAGEGKKEEEPAVSIDEYVETVEIENKFVSKKRIFDVAALRKLVAAASKPTQTSKSSESADVETPETPDAPAETASDSTEEEPASPLEKAFPYLDPESGEVDVSSTQPDNVPAWYAANDYEVMHPGKEWEYVRMTQGSHNALGRVKVIFPNMHDVYLHDTPKKALFKRDIRAFSHGCMRMHEPLDMAEYLLKKDGKFGEVDVEKLLEGEKPDQEYIEKAKKRGEKIDKDKKVYKYKPVFLDKQIPVHIEYFTVRVDDEGRPHFLADIYDKDKKALAAGN